MMQLLYITEDSEVRSMEETNYVKMIEQAQMMAKLMGGGTQSLEENQPDMEKMLDMMKLFQSIGQNKVNEPVEEMMERSADIKATAKPEGRYMAGNGIQAIKAAIPYLDHRYRKTMLLFIKVMEIHRLMEEMSDIMSRMEELKHGH